MKKVILLLIAVLSLSSFSSSTFRVEDKKVVFRATGLEEPVTEILVVNSEGIAVYSEKLQGDTEVGKIFNFENAYSSTYTIVITNGESTYKRSIIID